MTIRSADRNLLFGLLALQNNFIGRDQLVVAFGVWIAHKNRPLDEILIHQKALDPPLRDLLAALVQRHLALHGNDPERSLAAISSIASAREELDQLGDRQLQASLQYVSAIRPSVTPHSTDPYATQAPSVGGLSVPGLRFRILRPHAKGGLGQVSVALDAELHREVALKEIQGTHADHPDIRARFLREAKITGGLEHPGIVPVYGLGTYADGRPFYAMKFIKGDSLKTAIEAYHRTIAKAKYSVKETVELNLELRKLLGRFIDVCNAMQYAHDRGVLHRDLKPGNIMLGKYGETLVVDWGLAKPLGEKEPNSNSSENPLVLTSIQNGSSDTVPGLAIGTPQYMSPEQASGRLDEVGPASDVYSLGATLYQLLTGQPPVPNNDLGDILQRVQRGDIPPPRTVRLDLPRALEAVCQKAMKLKLTDRYHAPRDLASDLEHWLADEPVSAWHEPIAVRVSRWIRLHRMIVAMIGVAMLVALAGFGILAGLTEAHNRELNNKNQQLENRELTARRLAYSSNMNQARRALIEGDISLGNRLLELHRPKPSIADVRGFSWYYLWRLSHDQQASLRGHSNVISCVTFSPDGKTLASGSFDRTVRLWNAPQWSAGTVLGPFPRSVTSIAFSADGTTLAVASREIFLFDAKSAKLICIFNQHGLKQIESIAFSPDGLRLAAAGRVVEPTSNAYGAASIIVIRTGDTVIIKDDSKRLTSVAFANDAALVTGSESGQVKVWNDTLGKVLSTFECSKRPIVSVCMSADRKSIGAASVDGELRVWNVATSEQKYAARCNVLPTSLALSSNASQLAVSGQLDLIVVDLRTSHTESYIGHTSGVQCVAFSDDGATLASGGWDEVVMLWDATRGREATTASLPVKDGVGAAKRSSIDFRRTPSGLRFSRNCSLLAMPKDDQTVELWNVRSQTLHNTLGPHKSRIGDFQFSYDASMVVVTDDSKCATVWDVGNGRIVTTIGPHTNSITRVAFSTTRSNLFATGDESGTVFLWNAKNGSLVKRIDNSHKGAITGLVFSNSGKLLASAGADLTVRLWDVETGNALQEFVGHTDIAWCLEFSPNDLQLATGSRNKTVILWEIATGMQRGSLKCDNDLNQGVSSILFLDSGRTLASACGGVWIWNIDSGAVELILNPSVDAIVSCDNERTIVGASADAELLFWNCATADQVGRSVQDDQVTPPDWKSLMSELLSQPTVLEFVETPLVDVVEYLHDFHGINIRIDEKALDEVGFDRDIPVTYNSYGGPPFRILLAMMLDAHDLTYIIGEGEIVVTTSPDDAVGTGSGVF